MFFFIFLGKRGPVAADVRAVHSDPDAHAHGLSADGRAVVQQR